MQPNIKNMLKVYGLRITKNRINILKLFLDDHEFHTISEISSQLTSANIKSIYNNIQRLVEVGILESFAARGEIYYEVNDNEKIMKNQAHVVSKSKIYHLDVPQSTFKDIRKFSAENDIDVSKIKIIIEEREK